MKRSHLISWIVYYIFVILVFFRSGGFIWQEGWNVYGYIIGSLIFIFGVPIIPSLILFYILRKFDK